MNKRVIFVLTMAAVLVFAFTAVATAKYAGYAANEPYLSWGGANYIYKVITGDTADQLSPHGGYTQTSVKCVVCHSTHRAFTTRTVAEGIGTSPDFKLLNGVGGSCAQCHAAWGASPSDTLVEIGETYSGPHIGAAGSSCNSRGCHGSVHGIGVDTTYAVVAKYNLGQDVTTKMNEAIAAGNVNAAITTTATGDAMKAYATGYVCAPCHGNSSFSIATRGFANMVVGVNYDPVAQTSTTETVMASGHPSASAGLYGHAPTCEKCHDMVGVATNSTAFPHANRGIDVYQGRFDLGAGFQYGQPLENATLVTNGVIATDNDEATRYTLWMTSSDYDDNVNAKPVARGSDATARGEGGGYSLRDGVCIKCHDTDPATTRMP